MELGLKGKAAIVTGASTGIGRATALALANEGVRVLGVSRRPPAEPADGVTDFLCDVSDADAPSAIVARALELFGQLDIVVNNAAAAVLSPGFATEPLDKWRSTFEVNLLAAVGIIQASLAHLVGRDGVIINVTSVNSRMPSSQGASYSASKAALLNIAKTVATEYAAQGVRVITVSPGLTATPMWLGDDGIASQIAAATNADRADIASGAARETPLGRFLEPSEIADCICFLASPRASGVTGAELVVDGGLTPTI